jgi:hypothetical protein
MEDEEFDDDFDDGTEDKVDLTPQRLRFFIGGYGGTSYHICWLPEICSLRVRSDSPDCNTPREERFYNVSDSQWRVFWHMLDSLSVWEWKAEYKIEACDGTSWNFDVINGSRRVNSEGSNAYPGEDPDCNPNAEFNVFLAAINMLCHRNDIS